MRWQEVVVTTSHDTVEAISNFFHELGAGGVVIEDPLVLQQYTTSGEWDYYQIPTEKLEAEYVVVKGYLPVDADLPYKLEDLKGYLTVLKAELPQCHLEVDLNQVEEEDWANSWKRYFKPSKISDKLVIVPSWEHYEKRADEQVILLDPGMAFGTGTHETTRLCIQSLEQILQGQEMVFDVGTGSGVLSLAAVKLGAAKVYATDIDRTAVDIAKGNMKQNQVGDRVVVQVGNLLQPLKQLTKPDVIVANIVADVILLLMKDAFELLKNNGYFLASGIIKERQEQVAQAMVETGFKLIEQKSEGEWVAILAKKE